MCVFITHLTLVPLPQPVHVLQVFLQVPRLGERLPALRAAMWFLPRVDQFVPLQVIIVQEALPAERAPVPLLPVVPAQVDVQLHFPLEFFLAQRAVEGFLPCVDPQVGLHVPLGEEALAAHLAGERPQVAVDHLEVLGQAEAVRERLAALRTLVALAAVHPAVPVQALGVREALAAERAEERPVPGVLAHVALQRRRTAEDAAASAALILQQAVADALQRLTRRIGIVLRWFFVGGVRLRGCFGGSGGGVTEGGESGGRAA